MAGMRDGDIERVFGCLKKPPCLFGDFAHWNGGGVVAHPAVLE